MALAIYLLRRVSPSLPADIPADTAPLAWWQHSLKQQLAAQQSVWNTWQVWAWIPWNLSLSAWQMAQLQAPAIPTSSGLPFSVPGGHTPSNAPVPV